MGAVGSGTAHTNVFVGAAGSGIAPTNTFVAAAGSGTAPTNHPDYKFKGVRVLIVVGRSLLRRRQAVPPTKSSRTCPDAGPRPFPAPARPISAPARPLPTPARLLLPALGFPTTALPLLSLRRLTVGTAASPIVNRLRHRYSL